MDDGIALRTMDIFAGCGGLSEGFQQAGAAICKWAVEYEHPAAGELPLTAPIASVAVHCSLLKWHRRLWCLLSLRLLPWAIAWGCWHAMLQGPAGAECLCQDAQTLPMSAKGRGPPGDS